jgi:hypothetical protein
VLAPLPPGEAGQVQRQLHVLSAESTGIRL